MYPESYNSDRPGKTCPLGNSGINIIGENKNFLIRFPYCSTRRNPYLAPFLSVVATEGENLLLLFCYMDLALNLFLMSYCYAHWLTHLSTFIREASICSRRWLTQNSSGQDADNKRLQNAQPKPYNICTALPSPKAQVSLWKRWTKYKSKGPLLITWRQYFLDRVGKFHIRTHGVYNSVHIYERSS